MIRLCELSWLWNILGILFAAVGASELLLFLICKIKNVRPNKAAIIFVACMTFLISAVIIFAVAKKPVLI